jgi:hypothetical protein
MVHVGMMDGRRVAMDVIENPKTLFQCQLHHNTSAFFVIGDMYQGSGEWKIAGSLRSGDQQSSNTP